MTLRVPSRLRMPGVAVPGAAALVLGLALACWATGVLLSPPGQAAGTDGSVTATVVEGEVGASLSLNAAAEWQAAPVGRNEAAGVVTSVDLVPGAEAQQGSRLYTVNGRAVVVARGAIPAYRPLSVGDSGEDVRQLQQLLGDTGFYTGTVDGVLGTDAAEAVERWHQSLGETASGEVGFGEVGFGELVFVPSLPARLTLDGAVPRGARLAGSEEVVLSLGAAPRFTVPVGAGQAASITTGAHVELTSPSGQQWQAVVGGRTPAATGSTVVLDLEPAAAAICTAACAEIPIPGQTLLAARIVTVETVRGAVVPTIALQTDAQQSTVLVDRAGVRHPVTVTASARGMSVVRGVDPGLVVCVPSTVTGVGESGGAARPQATP